MAEPPTANDDDLDRGRIFTHEVPLARAHLEIATVLVGSGVERRSQKRQKDEPNDIWKRRRGIYLVLVKCFFRYRMPIFPHHHLVVLRKALAIAAH